MASGKWNFIKALSKINMKYKKLLLLLLICSCAQLKNPTDKEIETYCQDLNVLYQRIALISSNIANVSTTRTAAGGPYLRQIANNCKNGFCDIIEDKTHPILKYEPNHPDANKNGYVAYPDINLKMEESDSLHWAMVYETVIANSPVSGNFFFKNPKAKTCFEKYPALKARKDYSEYLGRATNQ